MKQSFNQTITRIYSVFVLSCLFTVASAQVSKTVSVSPGGLSAIVGDLRSSLTDLTVTGSIDARDIAFMRDSMPMLAVVDMESVNIMAYKGAGGTCSYIYPYSANEMPRMSFFHIKKFTGSKTLRSIKLPGTITSIGDKAFESCHALTSIIIPNSVQTIREEAFIRCRALASVTIGKGLSSVGDRVFVDCTLLTTLNIPASVSSLGSGVLAGDSSITSITVDANNSYFSAIDGVLFNKDQTTLVYYPTGRKGAYTIPQTVNSIGYGAFSYCNGLTDISIHSMLSIIEDLAFSYCTSLTKLTLPEGLDEIGSMAFSYCSALKSVSIPRSVSMIGNAAFQYCTALSDLKVWGTMPVNINLPYRVFQNVNYGKCILQVPLSAVSEYKVAPFWSDFRNISAITQP